MHVHVFKIQISTAPKAVDKGYHRTRGYKIGACDGILPAAWCC